MKKLLFFIVSVSFCTVLHVNAQTVIFEEGFDSITEPNLPANWTTQDKDGDGKNWSGDSSSSSETDPYGFSGNFAYSLSYSSTPDNLLITPAIVLPVGSSPKLAFLIGGLKVDVVVSNPQEHYAIYVLPSGSIFQGTEQPLLEETLPNAGTAFSKKY